MNAGVKLGVFSAALAVVFAAAAGIGQAVGPIDVDGSGEHADMAAHADTAVPELPAASSISEVDGFTVAIAGDAQPGDSELTFTVTRDGVSVSTEPYLGALGHLIAIRAADLAYLHVHAHDSESGSGSGSAAGPVSFTAEFPTVGTHRLFFDFSVDGEVHTAAFTIEVGSDAGPDTSPDTSTVSTEEGDDHDH